jgi:uncharacterized protein YbbC (DUF1343 family)
MNHSLRLGFSPLILVPALILVSALLWAHDPPKPVVPGIEVLISEQLDLVKGKRIGLITNHTGVDRNLRHDIDVLTSAPELRVVALFSPEHGIRGTAPAGEKVRSSVDEKSKISVYSLYGEVTRPTAEMLKEVDVLLYDIQDVGSRFYTYISTLGQCMEAASEKKLPFVVLDRPAPIGAGVEGPLLKLEFRSFVGAFPIPIRYGLTPGELAGFIKAYRKLDLTLSVVKMKHWQHALWYDETGLVWLPPSPNIPALTTASVYPGMCLFEGTNLSEGRGTLQPFETVGAPWIDGLRLAEQLNGLELPGILFRPVSFTPSSSKFVGAVCHGIQVHVVDRKLCQPVLTALTILQQVRKTYPGHFQFGEKHFDRLAGSDSVRKALEQDVPAAQIVAGWQEDLKKFDADRKKYLLYP